jgi:hypothetical protein
LLEGNIKPANHEFKTTVPAHDTKQFIKTGNKSDANKNYFATSNDEWFEIEDPQLIGSILGNYGDEVGRRILQHVARVPMTMYDLLTLSGIPQSSGYRKMMSLVDDHLLTTFDTVVSKRNGRRMPRYISTFKNIQIEINEKITVRARLNTI